MLCDFGISSDTLHSISAHQLVSIVLFNTSHIHTPCMPALPQASHGEVINHDKRSALHDSCLGVQSLKTDQLVWIRFQCFYSFQLFISTVGQPPCLCLISFPRRRISFAFSTAVSILSKALPMGAGRFDSTGSVTLRGMKSYWRFNVVTLWNQFLWAAWYTIYSVTQHIVTINVKQPHIDSIDFIQVDNISKIHDVCFVGSRQNACVKPLQSSSNVFA